MLPPEQFQQSFRPEANGEASLGDFRLLLEYLGHPEEIVAACAGTELFEEISFPTISSLRHFLQQYCHQVLIPIDLPSIYRGYWHAVRNESRELIDFDRQVAVGNQFQPFARASQQVGRVQLRRLCPMRDQRLVQRYWQALDQGEANGWHTVVYGVTLAIFSLPLRQGLLKYAERTLNGLSQAACRTCELPQEELHPIIAELSHECARAIFPLLNREPYLQS